MYTKETIKKYTCNALAIKNQFDKIPADTLKIHITQGNSKIGKVLNVSLPPVMSCHNCSGCQSYCYDIKACLQYPGNVLTARIENLVLLEKDRDRFFAEIAKKCSRRRKNFFFRFHVAGDIVDTDYLSRMVALAEQFPHFKYWTYTKNYSLVNAYIDAHGSLPENLIIVFSEWRGMPVKNPHKLPEFRVVFKDDKVKPQGFYCPGNCDICKVARRGCIAGETTYCHEH